MKKVVENVFMAALGGAISLGLYFAFSSANERFNFTNSETKKASLITTNYTNAIMGAENTDFTLAAEKSLSAVVHVKNTMVKTYRDPFAEFFYGQGNGLRQIPQVGTGSGVIISEDGYIITNNHVINQATEIEITLDNKKVYKAELVGADATNDIALLKIEAKNLPYIIFGDSNSLKVGEWVLAVGNPYNLNSTVTAGIVSAKGRDLDGNSNIDSFIQTDAAVNPGNSGGALVNTNGELVGINTAISSTTGSFVGYSFAVPSNIAKKIIEDLMEFGDVQNAILGVKGGELNGKAAEGLNIDVTEGFFIAEVTKKSGAEKAGLKEKDVIVKINNSKITSYSDLTGFLRTKRPNDVVEVTYLRSGKTFKTNVTLSKNETTEVNKLGLEVENIPSKELKAKKISSGVRITSISNSELQKYGVKEGYIIIAINGIKINSVSTLNTIIGKKGANEVLRIEIMNLNGEIERYIYRD